MGLIDGWCGCECHGVVINTCQYQPIHPSLMCEEQSCVSKLVNAFCDFSVGL